MLSPLKEDGLSAQLAVTRSEKLRFRLQFRKSSPRLQDATGRICNRFVDTGRTSMLSPPPLLRLELQNLQKQLLRTAVNQVSSDNIEALLVSSLEVGSSLIVVRQLARRDRDALDGA